jgi:hypothetical protein
VSGTWISEVFCFLVRKKRKDDLYLNIWVICSQVAPGMEADQGAVATMDILENPMM